MKRTLLTLLALTPLAAGAADKYWVNPSEGNTCYWVDGFSLDNPNTWNFDVDKKNNIIDDNGVPSGITGNGEYLDGHYCWAASAANIIAQWEAKNVETVQATQNRAPRTAEDIFDEFVHTFKHMSGETSNATNWYFNGGTNGLDFKAGASSTTGGYYKNQVNYTVQFGDPMSQENSGWTDGNGGFPGWNQEVYEANDQYLQFTTTLAQSIQQGYSISIAADGEYIKENGESGFYSHALTLWGIEVDNQGHLTRMWLTDSDDATSFGNDMGLFSVSCGTVTMQSPTAVTTPDPENEGRFLFEWVYGNVDYFTMQSDVAREDGDYWYNAYNEQTKGDYLSGYSAIKVTSLVGMPNKIPNVPEPATGTLSLLALAALCARRKRK